MGLPGLVAVLASETLPFTVDAVPAVLVPWLPPGLVVVLAPEVLLLAAVAVPAMLVPWLLVLPFVGNVVSGTPPPGTEVVPVTLAPSLSVFGRSVGMSFTEV